MGLDRSLSQVLALTPVTSVTSVTSALFSLPSKRVQGPSQFQQDDKDLKFLSAAAAHGTPSRLSSANVVAGIRALLFFLPPLITAASSVCPTSEQTAEASPELQKRF